jgi:hypothetical protein
MFKFLVGFLCGVAVAGSALWQLLPDPSDPLIVVHRVGKTATATPAAGGSPAPAPSSTLTGAASALKTASLATDELDSPGVPLPDAHRELLAVQAQPAAAVEPPSSLAELHQRFESEDKDPAWAYDTERQLKSYLLRNAPSPRFDVFFVECRKSLCEIQARGYTPTAGEEWKKAIDAMAAQPWWTAFSGNSSSSSEQNGQAVMLTLLHRR